MANKRSRENFVLKSLVLLALLLGLAGFVHKVQAQVLYGSIVGHVVDSSGAAIPDAKVLITNKGTGTITTVTSNSSGDYSAIDIVSGEYKIEVTKEGFKTFARQDVTVTLNAVTRVDISLEVGAVTESVTVSGAPPQLQTDTSEVHADVAAQQLSSLPVPLGRNYQQIYRALPGFSPPANSHSIPTNPSRSLEFNVNGTSDNQNNTRIDGVSTYNIQLPHVTSYVPTLESIDEVSVVTNSFDAEQGFAGGAAINVQTKSGGNQIHGSLFEYNSNNHLKAWPMEFDNAGANVGNKPKAIYNQYGGSVGGPIKKDKLFYFVSFEGTGDHRAVQRRVTIPSADAINGDLSGLAAALGSDIYDPMTGDPVTGEGRSQFRAFPTGYIDPSMVNAACTNAAGCPNMIPTSRLDPSAQKILALLPATNQPGREYKTNNYFVSAPFSFDRHQVDTKVNYNPSSKLSLIGTFGKLTYKDVTPTVFGSSLVGTPIGGTSNPGQGTGGTYRFTIMGAYTFTPNFLMDAHFGYARQTTNSVQPGLGTNVGTDVLGIPGTNGTRAFESGWPEFDVSGFATMGVDVNFMPYYRKDPQSQYVANFNWIKGNHNIRFGSDFYRMGLNHTQAEFLSGNAYGAQGGFDFSEGFTQNTVAGTRSDSSRANSLASFLLGLPDVASRTFQVPEVMKIRAHLLSAYVRDRWNVTPKLTLDYGVRWEYIPVPTRDNRGIERYDPTSNNELVCGVGSVPKDCGITVSSRMFAPRVGFAYRASNTFVVRAGYGITYDPYMALEPLRGNYPTMVALVDNTSDVIPIRRLSNSTPSFSGAGSLPVGISSIPAPSEGNGVLPMPSNYDFLGYPQNVHRGYVESWNFTLQKDLGHGFSAQAGYVATRSIRQLAFLDSNAGQVLGAGDAGRPLFTTYGRTGYTGFITPVGTGHYDSLQAQLMRRFSEGLSFTVNYTWSKAINAVDNSDWSPAIQAIQYLSLNRAPTTFDRTHNFQFMSTWQLPFGKGKRYLTGQSRVVDAIVSGWQTNSLISLMTGVPFTVYASGNLNMPGNTQTADLVKSSVTKLGGTGTGTPFYDPTAFADVNTARFGTSGFNSIRGPGLANWDFGVTREFAINERWKLQFRMESFNFTNSPHFDLPDSCPCDGSDFMTITGVTNLAREGIDERQFRFGLRLAF